MANLHQRAWGIAALLLAAMVGLMWRPIHEESATDDEARILAAGYAYWEGYNLRLHQGEPPLAVMWSAIPMLAEDIKISSEVEAIMNSSFGHPLARTWSADRKPVNVLSPSGRDNWYLWPWYEGARVGELMVYRDNGGERLVVAGRFMEVALALLTGVLIFLWTRQLAGSHAALLALAMWCFTPVVLAHGHLIQTDPGAALTILAAVWVCGHFLQRPTLAWALATGGALGVALATKLSALTLLPIYALLSSVRLFYPFAAKPTARDWLKYLTLGVVCTYVVLLVTYASGWRPPPPLSAAQADVMEVPQWFRTLRPILIPADLFKDVALQIGTARGEHLAGYLFGQWSARGWWYYYLVALWLKSPIPWLILAVGGLFLFARRLTKMSFEQIVPWVGVVTFLCLAGVNKTDIGIRHLFPVFALLPVAVASQIATAPRAVRIAAWALSVWLAGVAVAAHPFYLEYFNEFGGGSKNGYRYLLDSNLDWGQDVKRLKRYIEQHELSRVYLDYDVATEVLQYYRVRFTRVTGEQARQLREGVLVISATRWMRPEWAWLKAFSPADRIGYSLFVFNIANVTPNEGDYGTAGPEHKPSTD